MKERNLNIDSLKGFLILLVVIGHIIQYVLCKNTYDNNFVFKYIYAFHMPLFMFLTGYLSYNANRKNDIKWLKKRAMILLIPFFIWSVVEYFVQGDDCSLIDRMINITLSPNSGYWFLIITFYNCLILYIANLFNKKYNVLIYLILVGFIYFDRIIGFPDLLKWHSIYFLSGYLFNRYKEVILKYKKPIFYTTMILFNTLVIFWNRTSNPTFVSYLKNINQSIVNIITLLYRYGVAFTGILFYYLLFQKDNKLIINKYLATLGKYTLEIYIIHLLIIGKISFGITVLDVIINFIICLFIPIIISKLLDKTKYMKKILFGR